MSHGPLATVFFVLVFEIVQVCESDYVTADLLS